MRKSEQRFSQSRLRKIHLRPSDMRRVSGFFGDAMDPSGNDYSLAECKEVTWAIPVSGWQETYQKLKEIRKND